VDTLLNNVRYAARMAWKNRIVTIVAVAPPTASPGSSG